MKIIKDQNQVECHNFEEISKDFLFTICNYWAWALFNCHFLTLIVNS